MGKQTKLTHFCKENYEGCRKICSIQLSLITTTTCNLNFLSCPNSCLPKQLSTSSNLQTTLQCLFPRTVSFWQTEFQSKRFLFLTNIKTLNRIHKTLPSCYTYIRERWQIIGATHWGTQIYHWGTIILPITPSSTGNCGAGWSRCRAACSWRGGWSLSTTDLPLKRRYKNPHSAFFFLATGHIYRIYCQNQQLSSGSWIQT